MGRADVTEKDTRRRVATNCACADGVAKLQIRSRGLHLSREGTTRCAAVLKYGHYVLLWRRGGLPH